MRSPMFDFIKSMYEIGLETKEYVYRYVPMFLTEEEYKLITNEDYVVRPQ